MEDLYFTTDRDEKRSIYITFIVLSYRTNIHINNFCNIYKNAHTVYENKV